MVVDAEPGAVFQTSLPSLPGFVASTERPALRNLKNRKRVTENDACKQMGIKGLQIKSNIWPQYYIRKSSPLAKKTSNIPVQTEISQV
jgi:hypothetical protein